MQITTTFIFRGWSIITADNKIYSSEDSLNIMDTEEAIAERCPFTAKICVEHNKLLEMKMLQKEVKIE